MRFNHIFSLFLLFALLAGCAATPRQPLALRADAAVETLAAMVSLSVKTPEGGTGGNGYLVYQRPDRFHLVMLTPFGTTVVEFFASDDRVTLIVPSKGTAYAGAFADLPEKNGLQGWRLMRWVVEGTPLHNPAAAGSSLRNGQGDMVIYDAEGLLERKVGANGDEVAYRQYQSIDGVPFPSIIEFTERSGVRVKIAFDEPEINKPLENGALQPRLDGLTILPLSGFTGM